MDLLERDKKKVIRVAEKKRKEGETRGKGQ